MALYAFDGTWNEDEIDDATDTNVVRFRELYAGADFEYLSGVGTRFGAIGRALGGLFGAGGHSRIDEMYDLLCENWNNGDRDIDLIGFSRGAALAVHFANKVAKKGIKQKDGTTVVPTIRFLGVWDIVASFGLAFDNVLPFQEINLGWNVDKVAANVEHCFHAMALDERRETFGVTRLDPEHRLGNVTELWFRGVHSDVGGGNGNVTRSNIALNWMLDNARECKVPLNESRAKDARYSACDPAAPISENRDPQRDKRREVLPDDPWHPTARPKELGIDESHTCRVLARLHYNWSGVRFVAGERYAISADPDQQWLDGKIECNADGWSSDQLKGFQKPVVKAAESHRRVPDANWFKLCGAIGDEEDELFAIGTKTEYQPESDGDLYLFANDLKSRYGNNDGFLDVTVTRIG